MHKKTYTALHACLSTAIFMSIATTITRKSAIMMAGIALLHVDEVLFQAWKYLQFCLFAIQLWFKRWGI